MNRLFTILVALFFLAGIEPAAAKSYYFPRVEIDVSVNDDGSFDLLEKRTFAFDGDFSFAFYEVPITGASGLADFSVSESGNRFTPDGSGAPGTVQINRGAERLHAKWFYTARDEQRTFTIRYKALDAVKAYSDVGEFYWKVIGPEWTEKTDSALITVHLPPGAGKEDVRAWGHGPLNGNVTIVDGRTVRFAITDLPNVRSRFQRPGLPSILAEEKVWADEANRRRLFPRFGNFLGFLLPLIGGITGFVLWRRDGGQRHHRGYPNLRANAHGNIQIKAQFVEKVGDSRNQTVSVY